jgi:ABC-2 type transport system ATP-binding protein
LIIENINKEMDQRVVLKNITLELAKHEIVGLVGRNGSGKTTLLRVMAGHYLPDAGDITIDQRSIF